MMQTKAFKIPCLIAAGIIAASCIHSNDGNHLTLWGSLYGNERSFVMGTTGDGVALDVGDSTVCVTRDGGRSWSKPVSLGEYKYITSILNQVPKCVVYEDYLYFFLVKSDEYREKRRAKERPDEYLSRFDLNTNELVVGTDKFKNPLDLFATERGLMARAGTRDHVVEFDYDLSVNREFDLPTTRCIALVPYRDGYCAIDGKAIYFYEKGTVSSIDMDDRYLDGRALFVSQRGTVYAFCENLENNSKVLKIEGPDSNIESYESFPNERYCASFSCGDAFFVITLGEKFKYHLVYSLDGGETWSLRKKVPFFAASCRHFAYYDGKLFY